MKFIERAPLGLHALMIFPRLGNHHHHGVRQLAASHDEQFHTIIKLRGIAAIRIDDRHDLLEFAAKHRRLKIALLRASVDVPRNMLVTIVRNETVGYARSRLGNVLVEKRDTVPAR